MKRAEETGRRVVSLSQRFRNPISRQASFTHAGERRPMTRNRLATSRWSLAAIIAGWTFVTIAPAQPAGADPIVGVYHGSYAGDEGPINFKLSITRQNNGTLAGVFTLYLTEGTDTKAYICDFSGPRRGNRTFQLIRGKWENLPPSGAEIAAGMNGSFDPAGGNGAGQISGTMRVRPGPKFAAAAGQHRNLEAKLADRSAHAIDGALVFARVARVFSEPAQGPKFHAEL